MKHVSRRRLLGIWAIGLVERSEVVAAARVFVVVAQSQTRIELRRSRRSRETSRPLAFTHRHRLLGILRDHDRGCR